MTMYRIYFFIFNLKKNYSSCSVKIEFCIFFMLFYFYFKILISHSCCIRLIIIEYQIYEFLFFCSFFFKCNYRNRSGHSFLLIFKICQKQPGTGCKVALYCTWVCPKYFLLNLKFNGV